MSMREKEVPQEIAEIRDALNGSTGQPGLPKFCTDGKRCGMGMACEYSQTRSESVEMMSLWGGSKGSCDNFMPRKELASEGDVLRDRSGRSKHNRHAFKPTTSQANIVGSKPSGLVDIHGRPLMTPDLQVKRHIKNGRNINEDKG